MSPHHEPEALLGDMEISPDTTEANTPVTPSTPTTSTAPVITTIPQQPTPPLLPQQPPPAPPKISVAEATAVAAQASAVLNGSGGSEVAAAVSSNSLAATATPRHQAAAPTTNSQQQLSTISRHTSNVLEATAAGPDPDTQELTMSIPSIAPYTPIALTEERLSNHQKTQVQKKPA